MIAPLPFANYIQRLTISSLLINNKNSAVLLKGIYGKTAIITQYNIILPIFSDPNF